MPRPIDTENSYGLFIGVGDRNGTDPIMSISANDAEQTSRAFAYYCQMPNSNLQTLTNADTNKNGLIKQLDEFAQKTQNNADLVVVYFSGHGCSYNGQNYLICHDTTNALENAIDGALFLEKLRGIQCKKLLVFLDCCHAGGFGQPTNVPFQPDAFKKDKNRVIITACDAEQVSYLSKPVSIFTYVLIEALAGRYFEEGEKDVTLFDLAMYLRERVVWLSEKNLIQQEPNIQKPQLYLLAESQTENFAITRHPKGKSERAFFDKNLESLTDKEDKKLDLGAGRVSDGKLREEWKRLLNINQSTTGDYSPNLLGDGNTVIYVTNNNHFYGTTTPESSASEPLLSSAITPPPPQKKHPDVTSSESKKKLDFEIEIKDYNDLKLGYPNELKIEFGKTNFDSNISKILYDDTISYCYQALGGRGSNLPQKTRKRLAQLIGRYLYKILFQDAETNKIIEAINQNEDNQSDIRLVLKFGESDEAQNLSKWPWEYLFYIEDKKRKKGKFLIDELKIVRSTSNVQKTIDIADKLKVLLFFCPKPGTYKSEHLDKINEIQKVLAEDYKGCVDFNVICPDKSENIENILTTKSAFSRTIDQFKPNVIHYIGEATIKDDDDYLYFWDASNSKPTYEQNSLESFYKTAKNMCREKSLKLVILQSWQNDENDAYSDFHSISEKLLKRDLPAMISFHSGFHIDGTNCFNEYSKYLQIFYELLVEENSLGDAIYYIQKELIKNEGCPIVYLKDNNPLVFKAFSKSKNSDNQRTLQQVITQNTPSNSGSQSSLPSSSARLDQFLFHDKQNEEKLKLSDSKSKTPLSKQLDNKSNQGQ
jgi:hypothetical protein